MAVIEGGSVISGGNVMPTTGPRIFRGTGAPAAGAYSAQRAVGDLYTDVATNYVYEFQDGALADDTDAWVRVLPYVGPRIFRATGAPAAGAFTAQREDGSLYIDTATNYVYEFQDGALADDTDAWVRVLPYVGPRIFRATGAPAAGAFTAQREDGSLYVDTTSGHVYEFQTDAWVRIDTVPA